MEKLDVLVIGAGVVGLAVAEKLSHRFENVALVDKEEFFGRHTSSRNSEVIHSGTYYPKDSLKAKLCIEGRKRLYRFLEEEELPHLRCGKFIVATSEEELPLLEHLKERGERNGVEDLLLVDGEEIHRQEPEVRAKGGLFVPSTGILDVHSLMKRLLHRAEENGVMAAFSTEVCAIEKCEGGYKVFFKGGDEIFSTRVVNSAGLFSDRVAEMAGIDIETCGYKLHYNKGEYYKTTKIRGMKHLIYPVPPFGGSHLGIHTRLHLDGTVSFGPNSYYVDEIDYSIDETWKDDFYRSISKFLRDISPEDISPDDTGIRAKLQADGEPVKDFVIHNETDRGLENFVNLIGIESPGLTSCLAIADYVDTLLQDQGREIGNTDKSSDCASDG
ncbi:MAG: NAD(P)/FAD-dependent oxidoreductase [Spirochaetes bacterium]|nr:MAG: NAD(P)/FAD-dependent oxidoreductase [Spirochaetota bacterium]